MPVDPGSEARDPLSAPVPAPGTLPVVHPGGDGQAPGGSMVASGGFQHSLPFDPLTFLAGLWRRKWLALLGFALSVALGVGVALRFGVRTYEAQTTLMFTGNEDELEGGFYRTPSLSTQLNMVKLPDSLARVRDRLQLAVEIKTLAAAIDASIQQDTSLLFIEAEWMDPQTAADVANTVRDVFLERAVEIRQREAREYADHLQRRLEQVKKELQEADAALVRFTNEHHVVNLDQESQWLLESYSNVDLLWEQAKIERSTVELQLQNLERIKEELRKQVEKERGQSAAMMESVTVANIRAERIRERIETSKKLGYNAGLLAERELEYERLKKLYEEGLVSQSEVETARLRYETQKARTLDSEEVKKLREELARLDEAIIPNGSAPTPSAPILQSILERYFDLQLQQASLDRKVQHYEEALAKLREKLDRLPNLQREYVILSRAVQSKETERKELETRLSEAQRLAELDTPYFAVITPAEPPDHSSSSNRRLLAVFVTILGLMATVAGVLAATLLDNTFKSQADLRARLRLPLVGEVPRRRAKHLLVPGDLEPPLLEDFKIMARAIRRHLGPEGGRVLVVSAEPREGRSTVAAYLAMCFGRRDERVLVLDGNVRGPHESPMYDFLDREGDEDLQGLGEYLSFQILNLDEAVSHTTMPGVDFVPGISRAVVPDLLASHRMRELLEEASQRYRIILVDGPPVLPYVDAEVLAEQCDAVLLVVRAGRTRPSHVRRTVTRLQATGTPILGVILNGVDPLYAERA